MTDVALATFAVGAIGEPAEVCCRDCAESTYLSESSQFRFAQQIDPVGAGVRAGGIDVLGPKTRQGEAFGTSRALEVPGTVFRLWLGREGLGNPKFSFVRLSRVRARDFTRHRPAPPLRPAGASRFAGTGTGGRCARVFGLCLLEGTFAAGAGRPRKR